ncbi:hypothetical protein [Listeria rocourtiae]|uniref:hypothetical protein n=1 Tax=Listeria rocourtiae TaxID=647910 RepID=UPI0003E88B8C|nr:hypothetical protein [Listeria rocourtiae]EUJ47668.1 hypothetical protein PROCOU_07768 [Listeria rocourtiae FSL F6-920]
MKKLIPVFMGILLLVVLAACGKEGIDKALSDKSLTMIQKVKTDLKDYQLAYVKDDDDKTGVLEYYKDSNKQDISNIQLDSALKKQDSEVKINLMNGLDGLIAMVEISGTKLAKEATELVLLDSNKEVDEAIGVSLTNRSEVKDGKTVAIVAIPSVDAKTASSLKRIELRNGSNEIIYQNNLDSSKIKAQALSERAKKKCFFPKCE